MKESITSVSVWPVVWTVIGTSEVSRFTMVSDVYVHRGCVESK